MNSFNWLDYIDLFYKKATLLNCSFQPGLYRFGSYDFRSFGYGSYHFGSFHFGSYYFGSHRSGQRSTADYQLLKEPLNLFGYGVDLI